MRPWRTASVLMAMGFAAMATPGCQASGTATAPRAARKPTASILAQTSFALAPIGEGLPDAAPIVSTPPALPVVSLEAPAPTVEPPAPPAPVAVARQVRVIGVARVPEEASRMANVRGGLITGTPVIVRDARTGRRLAEAVTYYDGSFVLEVALSTDPLPVIVSTSLVDAGDATLTVAITAPAVLVAEEREVRLNLTPGSTALTAFLGAVAGLEEGPVTTLSGSEPVDPGIAAGPKLGALIAGIDAGERESFARLAEAAPELKAASDVATLRDGIRRFVGRIAVRKAS